MECTISFNTCYIYIHICILFSCTSRTTRSDVESEIQCDHSVDVWGFRHTTMWGTREIIVYTSYMSILYIHKSMCMCTYICGEVFFEWPASRVWGEGEVFWMRITDSSFKAEQEILFILFSCQTRVTTLCLYTTTNQCSVSPSRFLTCCIHNNMRSLWPLTFDHLISLSWVQLVKMWRNYQKTDLRYHVQEAKTCFVTLTFDLEHPNLMSSSVWLRSNFSLITDSVVVDSQRLTVKSWPQLWSQTPHIWENWIWVPTGWRTQEWSCCVLDWRVQTVDWRLWGP